MPDTPTKLAALTQAAIEALPGAPGSRGWIAAFRATLARAHTAAYLAATAERLGVSVDTLKGISRAERADITRAVDAQLKYLAGFQQAIPTMTPQAIAARAQLYAGPVKTTYYATRWGEWDIPPSLLPGNQQCLGNCLCRISVTDDGDGKGTLTRTMGGTEHHCSECPPLQGDHPVKRRGAETKAQTAEERAMFANMGAAGTLRSKGPGGKRTGPVEGAQAVSGDAAARALRQKVNLSTDEQIAVNWYASVGHDKINAALRGHGSIDQSTLDRTTTNLDRVMTRHRTSVDSDVHRGMLVENEHGRAYLAKLQPGATYRDPGYVSTSTHASAAEHFGYGVQGRDGTQAVSMRIRVPKGTPALHMGSARPHQGFDEGELLLRRGLNYRVKSRTDTPGHTALELEVVL